MRPPEPSPERVHVHSSVNLHPGEQGSSCDALCTPFLRGNLRFALLPLLWAWLCCGCRLAADAGCCWRALPPTPGSAHLLISVFVAPAPLPGAFLAEAGMRSTAGGGFFASQEGCSLGGSFAGSGGWDGKRERGYRRPSSGAGNRIEDGRQLCSPTRLKGREREKNNIQCLQPCLAHTLTSPP